MSIKFYFLFPFLMLFLLCSCNKNSSSSTPSKTYSFYNNTGRKVFLDFYKTKGDLNNNRNAINRLIANNGETVKIDLEPKKTVCIDLYSEDYVITNWLNYKTNGDVFPSQNFYADSITTDFSITKPDTITQIVFNRRLLINKNMVSQDWKAISFFPDFGNVNTWNQLPTYQKVLGFSFQKDFYMFIHYQDSNGVAIDAKTTMKIYYDKFKLAFTNNSYLKGEIFSTASVSYDTLEFHVTDFAFGTRRGMYQLVRK